MLQALMASFKSKDPNTKVGCVFVDQENHQISMGFNGAVAGIDESQLPWGRDRSVPLEHQKYGYVVHAEANAISHCMRQLKGSKLYVTLYPCHECAKLIASQKVSEVIFLENKYAGSESEIIATKIFRLAGVKMRQLSLGRGTFDDLKNYLNPYFDS